MRFNIASLCGFLAIATQVVTAEPAKWDRPQNDKWYASSAAACGLGSVICSNSGEVIASNTLGVASFCCAMAGITAMANRQGEFDKTKRTIGSAAKLVKAKAGQLTDKTGQFIVDCKDKFCKLIKKPKPLLPTTSAGSSHRSYGSSHRPRDYQRNQKRSAYKKMKRSSSPGMKIRNYKPMEMDYYY